MLISKEEHLLLTQAFQSMISFASPDLEGHRLCREIDDFLRRVSQQPDYPFTSGEVDNCVIALQLFCSKNPSASSNHAKLLKRLLPLQFQSF